MNAQQVPTVTDIIDYELIHFFGTEDLKNYYLNILRKKQRSNRVASNRERLKEKISQCKESRENKGNENIVIMKNVECQTNITINPFEDEMSSLYSSVADDISLSDDEENYRNCVIKRINRHPIRLNQDIIFDDPVNNISSTARSELKENPDLYPKYTSSESISEEYIWDCFFRDGIKEYDSPVFFFSGLKFRLSLLNNGANKLLLSLLDVTKEAKLRCIFRIHSLLLTTGTRSNHEDYHYSYNTGYHHGVELSGLDLLSHLESGNIKFSATLITRKDNTGTLVGNDSDIDPKKY